MAKKGRMTKSGFKYTLDDNDSSLKAFFEEENEEAEIKEMLEDDVVS